jgi:RimJ/RimL family protein N-acetyltransferase
MPTMVTEAKQPVDCTDAEIAAFCCLVRRGGEVEFQGLEKRARRARVLVFLYVDRVLVGIAAVKRPGAAYRDGVFRSAGVSERASSFELELGWVFVPLEYRGKHYSLVAAQAAMSRANDAEVFATTRADNVAMQRTLQRAGFRRLGDSWTSKRGDNQLVLYVTRTKRP